MALWLLGMVRPVFGQEQFYNYYDKGLQYSRNGDWLRAIEEFKSAISLEFEDKAKKRTYGTKFIGYFPHRELGIAYYRLGAHEEARRELELSLEYKRTKEAEEVLVEVLQKGSAGTKDIGEVVKEKEAEATLARLKEEERRMKEEQDRLERERQKKLEEEKKKLEKASREKEKQLQEELKKIEDARLKLEQDRQKLEKEKEKLRQGVTDGLLPAGALTYDPAKVTQVGTRLSIAVLPFVDKGKREHLSSAATDKMINQLVNMRRFRVVERAAMDAILKEQDFSMTDFADQNEAVKVGKLLGSDAIVIANINSVENYGSISVRVVDTETAETIAAKDLESDLTYVWNVEHTVSKLAIQIYNEMPLVEGFVVRVEDDQVYFDLGVGEGIRKGTKCVLYREGEEIRRPKTKEVLGKKVTRLAEAVVVQVQERLSVARMVAESVAGKVETGDKIVVK